MYSFIWQNIHYTLYSFCFLVLIHVPYFLLYIENRAFIRYARAYSVHFVRDILLASFRMTDVLRQCFTRYDFVWGIAVFNAARMLFPQYARMKLEVSPPRWRIVDVVADRAGFVDNEPSFTNGSPVTKPGRLRPCAWSFSWCSSSFRV